MDIERDGEDSGGDEIDGDKRLDIQRDVEERRKGEIKSEQATVSFHKGYKGVR